MARDVRIGFLLFGLFLSSVLRADYVLTFRLDLVDESGKTAKKANFIAVLADHLGKKNPSGDFPLGLYLLRLSRSASRQFIVDQLENILGWYPKQMQRFPEMYGAPDQVMELWSRLTKTLREDSRSSFLFAVEAVEDLRSSESPVFRPLASLRFAYVDEDGRLPAEYVYDLRFPMPSARRVWLMEPSLRIDATLQDLFAIERRKTPRASVAGEKLGLHHWGLDPRSAKWIFPRFVELATALGLFSRGSLSYPKSIHRLLDGTPILPGTHEQYTRRISEIWTEDYSEALGALYKAYSLKLIEVKNDERTGHRNVYIRRATAKQFETAVNKVANRRLAGQASLSAVWSYDTSLANQLGLTLMGCVPSLETIAPSPPSP